MANETTPGNGTGAYRGGIPLNVTLYAWPIPKLETNIKQINDTNYMIDKNSESAKNYTNSLHNLNATGYVAIDDDLTDTGLTDVQTFILAGVATVIPLVVIVITILGIRVLWRRYRTKKEDGYEGVLQKEESSEPLGKLQSYSLPQELKTSESQFTVTPGDDLTSTPSTQLPTPKSNGSVITMTLKNNHLIVETEETVNTPEGIRIESKGTTTKFVTSKAADFRFEAHSQPPTDYNTVEQDRYSENVLSTSDHGALVHCEPEEITEELEKGSCNTGLSQSDLSVSSTESQNPSYRYGNQMGYDSGCYGYPEYTGYITTSNQQSNQIQLGSRSHKVYARDLSCESAQVYKADNRRSGQFKDILMSDIQARETRELEIKNQETIQENAVDDIVPNSSSSTEIPELQVTHLKQETPKFLDQITNDEVNGKETKGS